MNWYKNKKSAERKEILADWLGVWNSIKALTSKTPNNGIIGSINGITIKLIDGDKVKLQHDIDFVEGGNDKAYSTYMPKNEIWIDKNVNPHNWKFICLHEFVERTLMSKENMSYKDAHKLADMVKREARAIHS